MDLLKVRVSNISEVAFSLFVNDGLMLSSNIVNEVEKVYSASVKSYCYKVILPNGALIGFFCVPLDRSMKKVDVFYIKKDCRNEPCISSFWQLISDTVIGEVYESISRFNSDNFISLLSKNITILERKLFYSFNYNLKA